MAIVVGIIVLIIILIIFSKFRCEYPKNWIQIQCPEADQCFSVGTDQVMITSRDILNFDLGVILARSAMLDKIATEESRCATKVELQELIGANGKGFFWTAKDNRKSAFKKGDWPWVWQCEYVTSSKRIRITVLCFNPDSPAIQQAIDFLKNSK